MLTAIRANRIWTGTEWLTDALVLAEDGCIRSLTQGGDSPVEALDLRHAVLAPAFFDVHTHGAAGHDLMEATPEAVAQVSAHAVRHGVGGLLATTVTAPLELTLRALSSLASQCVPQGVLRGIHLEGPFLSHGKRGVHPINDLREPDIALFDRLQEAAEGKILLMTLAPELPGACELIAHATARGVRVSLGHSMATAGETQAAIAAGAVSATHTFNAMRPMEAREPGITGAVLTNPALYAELICDGVHTAPEMVQLWSRMKGPNRALLVTDAMSAAGMPDGRYRLGELDVDVCEGRATTGGVLAGSTLTLNRALQNFMRLTSVTLEEALPLVTTNPARMTGLEDSIGRLAPGMPANLVVLDEHGQLQQTILNGAAFSAR